MNDKKFLSKDDVCELLNISTSTLDRIVLDGMLPVYRIRGQCRFKSSDVDMYIDACREVHTPVTIIKPAKRSRSKMSAYVPELPAKYVKGMKVV